MDPASWPDGEMSELERRLLDAGRHDGVPDALRARMAEGLGLQLASATLGGGVAAAQAGTSLLFKAGLWGVLSVAALASVWSWQATQRAPRAQAPAPAAAEARVPEQPAIAPRADQMPAAPQTAAQLAEPAAGRSTPPASAPVSAPVASADDAALRAEVALLDRARRALHAGASERALRLLDQHARRFASGTLAPEAAALRIEALVKGGSHARAEALSQQFVSAYPSHPLRARVSGLVTANEAPSSR